MEKKQTHYVSYIIGIISVFCCILLDQWTKYLAVEHLKDQAPFTIIKNVFELQYLENRGAAFGMMQGRQFLFFIGGVVVLIGVLYLYYKAPHTKHYLVFRICLILLLAGAIGNMIDRIRLGYVVDFFYFELIDFPIFNVADICVVAAAIGFLFLFLFFYKKEEDLEFLSFRKKAE